MFSMQDDVSCSKAAVTCLSTHVLRVTISLISCGEIEATSPHDGVLEKYVDCVVRFCSFFVPSISVIVKLTGLIFTPTFGPVDSWFWPESG